MISTTCSLQPRVASKHLWPICVSAERLLLLLRAQRVYWQHWSCSMDPKRQVVLFLLISQGKHKSDAFFLKINKIKKKISHALTVLSTEQIQRMTQFKPQGANLSSQTQLMDKKYTCWPNGVFYNSEILSGSGTLFCT